MANPSFDIVSTVNIEEVENAVQQAVKEISQRYDFKGSDTTLELNKKDNQIHLKSDDDYKLKATRDILESKLHRRGIALRNLEWKSPEGASGGTMRQDVTILQGIDQDRAKKIVKNIKDTKMKVQAAIQGEQVRVSGKKLDDLQDLIQKLKAEDFGIDLQFENFRS